MYSSLTTVLKHQDMGDGTLATAVTRGRSRNGALKNVAYCHISWLVTCLEAVWFRSDATTVLKEFLQHYLVRKLLPRLDGQKLQPGGRHVEDDYFGPQRSAWWLQSKVHSVRSIKSSSAGLYFDTHMAASSVSCQQYTGCAMQEVDTGAGSPGLILAQSAGSPSQAKAHYAVFKHPKNTCSWGEGAALSCKVRDFSLLTWRDMSIKSFISTAVRQRPMLLGVTWGLFCTTGLTPRCRAPYCTDHQLD